MVRGLFVPWILVCLVLLGCTAQRDLFVPQAPPLPMGEVFRGRILTRDTHAAVIPARQRPVRWLLDLRPALTTDLAQRTTGEGITDLEGRFALPSPPVADGYFSLWCELASGWVLIAEGVWNADDNSWQQDWDYEVPDQGWFWRVRIEDPEQRPIAGAIVKLVLSPDGAPIGAMRPAGITNGAGIVEFHTMEYGNYYADILAPGYAPKRVGTHQFEEATDGQSLDRRSLAIGHVLQGRIVGVERAVLEKTDLRVCDRWGSEWCIGLRTDGTFSLVVPAHEEVRLVASAPDHEYSTVSVRGNYHVMMKLAPIEDDS